MSADTNSAYDRWGGHVKQVGLKGGCVIRVHADGAAVDVLLDDGSVMEACPKKRLRAGPTGAEAVEATELSWLAHKDSEVRFAAMRALGPVRCKEIALSVVAKGEFIRGTTILRRAAATALIAFGEFTEAQSYGFITQVTELLTSPPEELLGTYALARERFEWARLLLRRSRAGSAAHAEGLAAALACQDEIGTTFKEEEHFKKNPFSWFLETVSCQGWRIDIDMGLYGGPPPVGARRRRRGRG